MAGSCPPANQSRARSRWSGGRCVKRAKVCTRRLVFRRTCASKLGPFDITRLFEPWETQKHNADQGSVLRGFAVSPGIVTGPACLIRSPADFERMRPDSILVCPTTTPAWTALFSQATGLVTDIGAVLAHGSIVAREYGIPAVLGCGNATQRIQDGQWIRVDGSAGIVELQPV